MSTTETAKRTPTVKYQELGTRIPIGRGMYRYKDLIGDVTYHERPWVDGKRTRRALGYNFTPQRSQKLAEEEFHRRRAEVAAGRDPYGDKKTEAKPAKASVEKIIREYVEANFPNRYLKPRFGRTLECEKANCGTLLEYCTAGQPWHDTLWDSITPKSWDDYHAWRLTQINGDDKPDDDEDADLESEDGSGIIEFPGIHQAQRLGVADHNCNRKINALLADDRWKFQQQNITAVISLAPVGPAAREHAPDQPGDHVRIDSAAGRIEPAAARGKFG